VRIGFGASKAAGALDPRILPDMGVKVSFLREEEPEAAAKPSGPRFTVPKAAVRTVEGKKVVFVLREDRVERRAVSAGLEDGDQVEVLSGVRPGEQVVVEGPPDLKDGDRVRVRS
jgi:multidrug efflux pump subunit AcrA (membrane-fusion protein)